MSTHVGDIFFDAKIDRTQYDRSLKSLGASATKASMHIGRKLAIGLATVGFGKFIKDATKAGASLNAMGTIIDASLPHMTKQVDEFAKSAGRMFGLSETQAKGFVGKFASMASAMGYTEEQAYKMSTALTGLAGDVASYYHISADDAYAKLGAVFTGETEALKQLGVVMTQNALDAFALEHGYGRVTSQMTELEKTTLRYNFVLDRMRLASGDFAKYANTWSGSIATIKLNWANFMATMGQGIINILLPLLQLIARISNALSALASRFLAFTKRVRGIKSSVSNAFGKGTQKDLKSAGTGVDNVGKGLGGAGKNAGKAKKAVQQLKRELLGFDKITKLSGENGTSSGGTGTSGGGGGLGGLGDIGLDDASLTQTAENYVDAFIEKLKQCWANADFSPIGRALANWINKGMNAIPWEGINDGLTRIAKSIGTFLNGFIEELDWGLLAKTISKGIASAIGFLATLIGTINWKAVGEAIVDAFFGIDWGALFSSASQLIGSIGGAIFSLIESAITTALSKIGEYFADSIETCGGDIIAGLYEGIVRAIADIANWIANHIFRPFIDGFKQAFGIASPSEKMKPLGKYIIDGVYEGIVEKLKDIAGWVQRNIFNPIFNAFKTAFGIAGVVSTKFKDLGGRLVQGVYNGIAEKLKDVKGWVQRNLFNPIINAVNSHFGTGGSYSTVFKTVGDKLMAGIGTGIANCAKSIYNTIGSLVNGINTGLKKITSSVNIGVNLPSWNSLKSAWNNLMDKFKGKEVTVGIRTAIAKGANTVLKIGNQSVKIILGKAKGGMYMGGSWHPIEGYAGGGSPNQGQLFYARENGAELVGSIKGHTAVMNNDQIVASVSHGVAMAMHGLTVKAVTPQLANTSRVLEANAKQEQIDSRETLNLLKQLVTIVQAMNLNVELDGESIKNNTVRRINQHTISTGKLELII